MARSVTRRRLVSAIGAGMALIGGGAASRANPLTTGTPTVSSVPGANYPAGWGPKELEQTLQEFITAFNEGDEATLSRFIPAKSGDLNDWTPDELCGFPIYGQSTSKIGNQASKADVLADFAVRHARRERWNLTNVAVAPTASPETLVYQMLMERNVRGSSASLGLGAGLLYIPDRTIPAWGLLAAPTGLIRLTPPFVKDPLAPLTVTKEVENFDAQMPSGCDVPALIAAVQRFFKAFNAGDEDALRGFIPRAGSSQHSLDWYDVFGTFSPFGSEFLGKSQDEVIAYFAKRHRHHERLRLLALSQVNWDPRTGAMGMTPSIARWADDIAPHIASGKMAMYCPGFQVQVWVQTLAPPLLPKIEAD